MKSRCPALSTEASVPTKKNTAREVLRCSSSGSQHMAQADWLSRLPCCSCIIHNPTSSHCEPVGLERIIRALKLIFVYSQRKLGIQGFREVHPSARVLRSLEIKPSLTRGTRVLNFSLHLTFSELDRFSFREGIVACNKARHPVCPQSVVGLRFDCGF